MGGIFMSKDEQVKFSVISDFIDRKIRRSEASFLLNVDERTVSRMARKIQREGMGGIKHGNLNRVPYNKTPPLLLQQALKLYEDKYYDMNVTHALEYLRQETEFQGLKYEVFRKKLKTKNLIKRKKRRLSAKRNRRIRSAHEGYILQMDGSHHKWNGKDEWCLIAAIDDATSDIPYAEFFLSEDTLNCMTVIQKIIEKKGIPMALYVDRAGWFGGQKRQGFSEFKRACEDLSIRVIFANSPQGKGRIERTWDTFQDRIIPEMRIRGITSIPAANSFLWEEFIPCYWRARNVIAATNFEVRYRKLPEGTNLDEIFCIKDYRQVKGDHTLSWNGDLYRVENDFAFSIARQSVEIRTYQNLQTRAFFAGKEVHLRQFEEKASRLVA